MAEGALMIAADPERLAAIEAKMDAILRKLEAVQMTPAPAWLTLPEADEMTRGVLILSDNIAVMRNSGET